MLITSTYTNQKARSYVSDFISHSNNTTILEGEEKTNFIKSLNRFVKGKSHKIDIDEISEILITSDNDVPYPEKRLIFKKNDGDNYIFDSNISQGDVIAGAIRSLPLLKNTIYLEDGTVLINGGGSLTLGGSSPGGNTPGSENLPKDIILSADASGNIRINKYFSNEFYVYCSDDDLNNDNNAEWTENDTFDDYFYEYYVDCSYELGDKITLRGPADQNDRWTFAPPNEGLILEDGTTMDLVNIVSMPSLSDGFGDSSESLGNNFFANFNSRGKLGQLPDGSFDISSIQNVGSNFFASFNNGALELKELPDDSFKFSDNLEKVGGWFFAWFNQEGSLERLPDGSFNTGNIKYSNHNPSTNQYILNDYYFLNFNKTGKLTELPSGSFVISPSIERVGYFFNSFNEDGELTGLLSGSFDINRITHYEGSVFYNFNYQGEITKVATGDGIIFEYNNSNTNPNTAINFYYKGSETPDSISSGDSFDGYNIVN